MRALTHARALSRLEMSEFSTGRSGLKFFYLSENMSGLEREQLNFGD